MIFHVRYSTINRYTSLTFVAGTVILFLPAVVQACAVCWIGASSPDDPMSHAFNWSILFLMAMPYTIVGLIVGWLIYTYRRAHGQKEGARRAP
jgi:heme/copper-type cytochrome/quinol oxidase subunit 2